MCAGCWQGQFLTCGLRLMGSNLPRRTANVFGPKHAQGVGVDVTSQRNVSCLVPKRDWCQCCPTYYKGKRSLGTPLVAWIWMSFRLRKAKLIQRRWQDGKRKRLKWSMMICGGAVWELWTRFASLWATCQTTFSNARKNGGTLRNFVPERLNPFPRNFGKPGPVCSVIYLGMMRMLNLPEYSRILHSCWGSFCLLRNSYTILNLLSFIICSIQVHIRSVCSYRICSIFIV